MNKVMSHKAGTVVIAIDPGLAGGIAIHTDGKVSAHPLDELQSSTLIHNFKADAVVYMEQVQGFIGKEQPGSAMFNFGNGYGFYRGVCRALDVPLHLVPPQKWMRSVAPGVLGMEYAERKRALLALAAHWWPSMKLEGMTKAAGLRLADSLCLLKYALGGPLEAAGKADSGRSRESFGSDAKGFKRYCKAIGQPVPKGQEFMQGLNWWVEQGRPAN